MSTMVAVCRKEAIVLTELDRRRTSTIGPLSEASGLSIDDTILALCLLKASRLADYDVIGENQVKHWRLTVRGRAWIFGGSQLAAVTDA